MHYYEYRYQTFFLVQSVGITRLAPLKSYIVQARTGSSLRLAAEVWLRGMMARWTARRSAPGRGLNLLLR